MPMTWLAIYAFTNKAGGFTVENFQRLFTEAGFLDPLIITFIMAVSSSVICCAVAAPMAWLVARTDLPFRRVIRALVTASFVTPPFLGAIAWELLAAPNSGLLNKFFRFLTGAEQDEYLFNIYTLPGLIFVISCYTFPYLFVLIANSLDRMPGDLEDASTILGGNTWVTARKITIPLALPALLAGVIVAFLQVTTLFGSPAILALPSGFHTMTTKIWSLFQYPPKLELAAAASLPLLLITVVLLRAEHAILGRRGYSVIGGKQSAPRLVRLGGVRWIAFGACVFVLLMPVILPYGALINAAFAPVATTPLTFANATLKNFNFVFFELSSTKLVLQNTFVLGALAATIGTTLALVVAYADHRAGRSRWHRALTFLAQRRSRSPGLSSASACSSAIPVRHSSSTARFGCCCSPISPSSCRRPISRCNPLSAPCTLSWRTQAESLAPRACRRFVRSPRRCCAPV